MYIIESFLDSLFDKPWIVSVQLFHRPCNVCLLDFCIPVHSSNSFLAAQPWGIWKPPIFCASSLWARTTTWLAEVFIYYRHAPSDDVINYGRFLPPPPTRSHPPWRHSLVSPRSFVEAQTNHKLYIFSLWGRRICLSATINCRLPVKHISFPLFEPHLALLWCHQMLTPRQGC